MEEIEHIHTIKLKLVRMYGKLLYFPECPFSEWVCYVANRKSLTEDKLKFLKRHFEIIISE